MTTDQHDRPDADKCADGDCILCYPPTDEGRPRKDVALEGFGRLTLSVTGKLSAEKSLAGFGHLSEAVDGD